jgi:hypothetical protein
LTIHFFPPIFFIKLSNYSTKQIDIFDAGKKTQAGIPFKSAPSVALFRYWPSGQAYLTRARHPWRFSGIGHPGGHTLQKRAIRGAFQVLAIRAGIPYKSAPSVNISRNKIIFAVEQPVYLTKRSELG